MLKSKQYATIQKLKQQVHSCRSEDALAHKRCEIKEEGQGDGSKKLAEKMVKN
jgi:hypothetical protein